MSDALRTLIVDDEPLARRALRRLLEGCEGVQVVGEATDGVEALGMLATHRAQLLLLDIEMPRLAGLALAARLDPVCAPVVVFVTAYPQHALRAFDVAPADYLLKPVDPARLMLAIERAQQQLRGRGQGDRDVLGGLLRAMPAKQSAAASIDHVWVSYGSSRLRLALREVEWFGADGDYVQAHTAARSYLMRGPLGELEAQLPADTFVRIHRSTVVNVAAVAMISTGRNGTVMLTTHGGACLAVGRRVRARVRRMLDGQPGFA